MVKLLKDLGADPGISNRCVLKYLQELSPKFGPNLAQISPQPPPPPPPPHTHTHTPLNPRLIMDDNGTTCNTIPTGSRQPCVCRQPLTGHRSRHPDTPVFHLSVPYQMWYLGITLSGAWASLPLRGIVLSGAPMGVGILCWGRVHFKETPWPAAALINS